MHENFTKSTQHPCMKEGQQMKKDLLHGSTANSTISYPQTGDTQQHYANGDCQTSKVLQKSSGLMGTAKVKGKSSFKSETAKKFV